MKHILVADDHAIVRKAIKYILKDAFLLGKVDEAANEKEVKACVLKKDYALIILDVVMPQSDFVRILEFIRSTNAATRVLVYSMQDETVFGLLSVNLGARGFLHKGASIGELTIAIGKVLTGSMYLSDHLLELFSTQEKNWSAANPLDKLSARELQVATLLYKGVALPDICAQLGIRYSSVNTLKDRAFRKLGVHNRIALARLFSLLNIPVKES